MNEDLKDLLLLALVRRLGNRVTIQDHELRAGGLHVKTLPEDTEADGTWDSVTISVVAGDEETQH